MNSLEHRYQAIDQIVDFLVIGAQKSATSWLYYCLRDHPSVLVPSAKKEVHYLGGDLYRQKGVDWYFSLFGSPQPDQKAGDVSVEYLFDPRSAEVVHRHLPDVRLIAILREPVERAISAYYWYVRKGVLPRMGPEEGLRALVAANAVQPEDGEKRVLRDILERGFYDQQLDRYLKLFEPEQLLVLFYDEITSSPAQVLKRVFGFVGVDDTYRPPSLHKRPKRNSRAGWLIGLERLAPRSRPIAKAADMLHQVLPRAAPFQADRTDTRQVQQRLQAIYRPRIERLAELLNLLPEKNRPAEDILQRWLHGCGRD